MDKKINIFYLAKPRFGGWVSFTAHLALKYNWNLYRITNTNEKNTRNFGYGVDYKNINIDSIPDGIILISAIDKNYYKYLDKIPDGSYLVIHDPTELKLALIPHLKRFKIITIRSTVHKYLLNKYNIENKFILHPFYEYKKTDCLKNGAVSISRIDYDKHTDILIEANNKLKKPIDIYGKKNDLYVYRKLGTSLDQYYWGCFAKEFGELDKILSTAEYMVDMSAIKKDGGGSQYTFLEAIYQGCILILNDEWVNNLDSEYKNNINCLICKDSGDIIKNIENNLQNDLINIKLESLKLLQKHIQINWNDYID